MIGQNQTDLQSIFTLKLNLSCLFTLLLAVLLPASALAQESTAAGSNANLGAANELAALLQDTATLQADVEQLTLDQDGREIQESRARLVMQKPDKFYWEILTPYQELTVTDGSRIWRFEADLEQLSIDSFNNDFSRTPVLLLNGDAQAIAASYTISSADLDNGAISRFILIPKASDNLFERLSLSFDGSTLTEMQFESSLGQRTSLTFSSVQVNQTIDPDTFVFQLPAGVEDIDVLDNTGF